MISNISPIATFPTGPIPDALVAVTGPEQMHGADLFGSVFSEVQDARPDNVQLPPPVTGLSIVTLPLPSTPTSIASTSALAPDDARKSNSLDETHKENANLLPISAAIDAALQIAGTFLPQSTMPRIDVPPPVTSEHGRPIEFVSANARMPAQTAVTPTLMWGREQANPALSVEQVNIGQGQAQKTQTKASPGHNTDASSPDKAMEIAGLHFPPVTSAEVVVSTGKPKAEIAFLETLSNLGITNISNTDQTSAVRNSSQPVQIMDTALAQNLPAMANVVAPESEKFEPTDTTALTSPDSIVPLGGDLLAKGTHLVVPTNAVDRPRLAESGFELRQIDLAADTLWLDNLAKDIASAARQDRELSFRLMPKELGKLDVSLSTSDTGLNVKMTTSSEESRAIFSAHQPRLLEELRGQGIKLTGVEVETGAHHQSRRNGNAPAQFIESAALATLADEMTTQEPLSGRFA